MALSTFRNPSRRARRRCFVAVLTAGCAAQAMSASAATTIYTQSNFSDVVNNVHFVALAHADLHRPPLVMFSWGGFTFKGVVESLTIRYTMFLPDGKPCRATANLSIKEAQTAKEQLEKNPRNSPDHTKRRTVKMGETLALIAHEEYDDPAEWRRIADANGIMDPRDVKPGTVLTLPPIL